MPLATARQTHTDSQKRVTDTHCSNTHPPGATVAHRPPALTHSSTAASEHIHTQPHPRAQARMEPSLTLMAPASLSHTLNYNLSQTQSRICIKFQSAARTLCTQSHNQILRDDLPRVADPRTPGWACPHRALQVRNHTGGQLVSHTHTQAATGTPAHVRPRSGLLTHGQRLTLDPSAGRYEGRFSLHADTERVCAPRRPSHGSARRTRHPYIQAHTQA